MSSMNALHAWLLATRPKTLSVSATPVLVGTALAVTEGATFQWSILVLALLTAMLIQIGTNLHNDYEDAKRGADTPERLGPKRAVSEGWLNPKTVRNSAFFAFGTAFLLGLFLVWHGGWEILVIGIASIVAGIAYTGGRIPIAYSASGELFAFLFFGLVATVGSHYLQSFQWSAAALWVGAALGFFAAAVLVVNNYRDRETDIQVGKKTLAVRIGLPATRKVYAATMVLPFFCIVGLLASLDEKYPTVVSVMSLLFLIALLVVYRFWKTPYGTGLNQILALTAQFQALFGLAIIFGLFA